MAFFRGRAITARDSPVFVPNIVLVLTSVIMFVTGLVLAIHHPVGWPDGEKVHWGYRVFSPGNVGIYVTVVFFIFSTALALGVVFLQTAIEETVTTHKHTLYWLWQMFVCVFIVPPMIFALGYHDIGYIIFTVVILMMVSLIKYDSETGDPNSTEPPTARPAFISLVIVILVIIMVSGGAQHDTHAGVWMSVVLPLSLIGKEVAFLASARLDEPSPQMWKLGITYALDTLVIFIVLIVCYYEGR